MPSPCTASPHAISVKALRWRTRSDHVTRNVLAARNNAAHGQKMKAKKYRDTFLYMHYILIHAQETKVKNTS